VAPSSVDTSTALAKKRAITVALVRGMAILLTIKVNWRPDRREPSFPSLGGLIPPPRGIG
jgi:hypothetical protein